MVNNAPESSARLATRSYPTNLADRRRQPELLDGSSLSEERRVEALAGLERLNRWSGSARILWRPIKSLAREGACTTLRILDIATGAGDIPINLWHRAGRGGVPVEIDACDVSPSALEYARRRCEQARARIHFFECDALALSCRMRYDVVFCSLFLHHLSEERATRLLQVMAEAARRLVLVSDLVRGAPGFALAYAATRLLTRSHVVHIDGPRSVEGALTPQEALVLASRAGLSNARITRRWPCRFLLTWVRR